jgi:hypothetical protein
MKHREDEGKKTAKTSGTQPPSSPQTDPTNPSNQEPTGDWVANEQAAERRNDEPGLTNRERQQRHG